MSCFCLDGSQDSVLVESTLALITNTLQRQSAVMNLSVVNEAHCANSEARNVLYRQPSVCTTSSNSLHSYTLQYKEIIEQYLHNQYTVVFLMFYSDLGIILDSFSCKVLLGKTFKHRCKNAQIITKIRLETRL